ncbi:MAG: hypothetical protein OEY52_07280 [Gammaproteobacteria bacterium]|nr:hypothetical protein [Gammaproteobacteria bacterium]
MKMYKLFYLTAFCILFLLSVDSRAETSSGLSFSVKAMGGGWKAKNSREGETLQSDEGRQVGFSIAYLSGNFYTGLNLQGGEYKFEKEGPYQVTETGTDTVSNDTINRSEVDLVFGYYLTQRISVFFDIKGTTSTWQSNNYQQEYGGLGIGIAGYWPVSSDWKIYGSFGVIPSGEVKTNGKKIGKGKSSGLDIGALYSLSDSHRLMFGIKSSSYEYEFDNGGFQKHEIGGVYVGYNYAFNLN